MREARPPGLRSLHARAQFLDVYGPDDLVTIRPRIEVHDGGHADGRARRIELGAQLRQVDGRDHDTRRDCVCKRGGAQARRRSNRIDGRSELCHMGGLYRSGAGNDRIIGEQDRRGQVDVAGRPDVAGSVHRVNPIQVRGICCQCWIREAGGWHRAHQCEGPIVGTAKDLIAHRIGHGIPRDADLGGRCGRGGHRRGRE